MLGDLGPTVQDGMALACRHCRYRFPHHISTGVMAAHFEVEHDTTHVHLDLVVICPRCDGEMTFERNDGRRDIFRCTPCHRTRSIGRHPPA